MNLKSVRLVENRANSDKFYEVVPSDTTITGRFTGCDNYLNGIYLVSGTYLGTHDDVSYWGLDGLGVASIVNTDTVSRNISFNESAILIFLEGRDIEGNVQIYNATTDNDGRFSISYNKNDAYAYKIYVREDDPYYTYLEYPFGKSSVIIAIS